MATSEARALRAAAAAAAVMAVAACGFPADTAGRRYRCEAGDPCPDGTMCVEGYCEQAVDVIDGGPPDDGAPPVAVCADGQLVAREEFDVLDEEVWWTWNNGAADVFASGGSLVVSSSVESNAGIIASEAEAMARLMVSVEVGTRSSGGIGSLAGLQLVGADEGNTVLELQRADDELRAMLFPYSVASEELAAIDFDAETQRFWRIITNDHSASFEYSSDEASWTGLVSRSIEDLPDEVKPQLQSGSFGDTGQDQAFDLLTVCRRP